MAQEEKGPFGILPKGPLRQKLGERTVLGQVSGIEDTFWNDLKLQIEDEQKAHDTYRDLAREAERLGIIGWNLLDNIAMDETRHKEILVALTRGR